MQKSEIITCDSYNLVKACHDTIASSKDKHSTQRFALHRLGEINRAQKELHNRTWKIEKLPPFIINERGHVRKIQGNTPYDRMIIHSYIDNALEPLLSKYLIYDNYASQICKGTSLARKRFETFLHKAYRKYKTNDFYVCLIDFSKFYDNIRHDKLKEEIFKYIPHEEFHEYMIDTILDSFKVDVSYMDNEEYACCLDKKYIALDHIHDKPLGEKYMEKSLNIGNQASQLFSIFYPTRIDNYCKIVKGIKYYGRYMDDIFIISDDKQFLKDTLIGIKEICDDMGLFINEKKTQIYKASKNFKYLNRIYYLTESGHLMIKLSNETFIRERRKLKKFKRFVDKGYMTLDDVVSQFSSWSGCNKRYVNKRQKDSIVALFFKLFVGVPKETYRHKLTII